MALLIFTFTTTTISAADWGLFELKGKVKSVTYHNGSCPFYLNDTCETKSFSFTNNGKVILPSDNIKLTRNSKGHITTITSFNSNDTLSAFEKVARDARERLTIVTNKTLGCQNHYSYDSNSFVNTSTEYDIPTGGCVTYSYTYLNCDEYGNWTKRTKKGDNGENITQTREITYHDGARKVKLSLITEASAHDSTATIAKVESVVMDTAAIDTTAKADTVATKTTPQKKSAATIVSGDLALFDLKGNVKSVKYKDDDKNNYRNACPFEWIILENDSYNIKYTIDFSENGKVIAPKGTKIIRDKKGEITNIQQPMYSGEVGKTLGYQKIKRDSKKRLINVDILSTKHEYERSFSYNKDGLIHESYTSGGWHGGNLYSDKIQYTYLSFDDNGNWTKRKCKFESIFDIFEEDVEYGEFFETREITYYDPSEVKASATAKKSDNSSKGPHTKSPVAAKDLKATKDRGLFDLYGNVKSVTYSDWACPYQWGSISKNTTISFNKEGKVNAPKKGTKIVRNSRGHITDIQTRYHNDSAGEYMWGSQEIKRDSKGRIFSQTGEGAECSWTLTHTYNSNGYISKSVAKGYDNGDPYKIVYKYTYLEFDDNGNWTKRKCTCDGETTIETRKIVYYKTNNDKKSKDSKKSSKDSKDSKKKKESKDSKKSSKSKDNKKSSSKKDSKKSSSSKSKSSKSSKK